MPISILSLFRRPSKEDPTVPLTADVIYGTQAPLTNVDTAPASGALYCSAIFSAEKFLVDSLASLPLISYDRKTKDRAEELPAYDILKTRPNEYQTPYIFWSTAWRKAIRLGNAYIFCEYNEGGSLANLIILENHRVKVSLENGTKQFIYEGNGGSYRIQPSQIIHLMGFSENGIVGVPLAQYAEQAIGLALVSEQYAIEFFTNSDSSPGYIKLTNPQPTDAQVKQIRASMESFRKDKGNQRYPIIPGGDIQKLGYDNQQSQMLESRQFQISEVARFTRVPPHVLYHYVGGGTYANLEAQNIDLVTSCLQPFITQWEQEVTRCIYGADSAYYVEALVDARLRGDTLSRMQAYQIGITTGIYTVNECRAKENLPPIKEQPKVSPQPPTATTAPTRPEDKSEGDTNGQ